MPFIIAPEDIDNDDDEVEVEAEVEEEEDEDGDGDNEEEAELPFRFGFVWPFSLCFGGDLVTALVFALICARPPALLLLFFSTFDFGFPLLLLCFALSLPPSSLVPTGV